MAEVIPASEYKEEPRYQGEINPAFSFPMSLPAQSASPRSAVPIPIRPRPADISIQSTPPFLFPPPSTPPLQDTAPSSPSRPRNAGHRRGPSEFIGGDGSKLGPGLMSTSPTKGENALPAPSAPNRRRGHAHRRSAAISHHDLTNIINGPENMSRRTGSAPATPSDPDMRFARPILDRARSQPSLPNNGSCDFTEPTESPTESTSSSGTTRPRVGFSDKLEYIPRPLSIISSATSSSVSTIRPSHSLNNSITSLRSFGTSSPPSAKKNGSLDDVFGGELYMDIDGSPSRDADSMSGKGRNIRRHTPPSQSQENMGLLEEDIEEQTESSTPASPASQLQADLSRLRGVPDATRPRSSPDVDDGKRAKRGKSWSDLLSRKSKQDPLDFTFPPRVDKSTPVEEPEFSLDDVNFDDDSTYIVRSPEFDVARSVQSNPSPSVPTFDPEDVGPVLDLDEVWRQAGNNTDNTRRQSKRALHSSGATGAFTGPGMHYHRRAESAPVMPPIDYGFGFPRYGSNPQMADVFEEEEDDYNQNSLSRQASRQNKIAKEKSLNTLGVNKEEEETPKVSPVEASTTPEIPRVANFSLPTPPMKKGHDLTITSTATHPVESAPSSASIRNYASSSHSSYPSQTDHVANFHGSTEVSPLQSSFDVPRLGTAHSSATDRSAWSTTHGQGGHPHAMSLDDVPSLVSSSSTMISHMPITPTIGTHMSTERSNSLTVESTMRPRTPLQAAKRASLASLSKLMGGSFSERSKLSIESKADYDEEEDKTKTKKRHRISRLMKMKFWKSKEDMRSLAFRDEPKTA